MPAIMVRPSFLSLNGHQLPTERHQYLPLFLLYMHLSVDANLKTIFVSFDLGIPDHQVPGTLPSLHGVFRNERLEEHTTLERPGRLTRFRH